MKKVLLTAVFAFIGSLVIAQERIAVFPFEDRENVLTRNQLFMLYDEFSNEFATKNAGRFIVLERQEVERLINTEYNFQLAGKFSERVKTAEYERVLNGYRILSGTIGRLDNNIRVTVSLFTYPDLVRLPGGATLSVANVNELFRKIPELVQNMQSEITYSRGSGGVTNRMYKIGDTGPAGGIIFYDRGFVMDGWRYLEAAPTDFPAQWGTFGKNISGTDTSVGSGKRNTQIIVEYLNRTGVNYRAAQVCAAMDVNGYKDWFLPSRDELDLMYKNLKQKGLGGFSNSWYWSSSPYNYFYCPWAQRFNDGVQNLDYEAGPGLVRAVRAF